MQTANLTLTTPAWTKLADASQDFVMSGASKKLVEVALTNADAAPGAISGHALVIGPGNEAINRSSIGPGFVWARLSLPDSTAGAFVVLTK